MRLFILGATGGTGNELIAQGLERGHQLTAFVRSPEKINRRDERLTVVRGDPLNAEQLGAALPGHDAVLFALGPRERGPTSVRGDCAERLVSAMGKVGIRRLLVLSTSFLFSDAWLPSIVGRLFFRNAMKDAAEMERVVRESTLNWTIVRPPRLTDDRRVERYRVNDGHLPRWGFQISRAGLAHFMLEEVERHDRVRKVVGVSV